LLNNGAEGADVAERINSRNCQRRCCLCKSVRLSVCLYFSPTSYSLLFNVPYRPASQLMRGFHRRSRGPRGSPRDRSSRTGSDRSAGVAEWTWTDRRGRNGWRRIALSALQREAGAERRRDAIASPGRHCMGLPAISQRASCSSPRTGSSLPTGDDGLNSCCRPTKQLTEVVVQRRQFIVSLTDFWSPRYLQLLMRFPADVT